MFGKGYTTREQENEEKSKTLMQMVTDLGFKVGSLYIGYAEGTATVAGVAQSREDKEKIVVAIGSTQGVERVDDLLRVAGAKQEVAPAHPVGPRVDVTPGPLTAPQHALPEAADAGLTSTFYAVKPGDSLCKIAKAHCGNASKYNVIFEANRSMLTDPNKIYPGQVLRIPP